jgi:hypothetical protein
MIAGHSGKKRPNFKLGPKLEVLTVTQKDK